MIQPETPGMKGLASKPSDPRDPRVATEASSVDRIANERETEVPQMHSNLMCATRLQLAEHQRNGFSAALAPPLYCLKVCYGISALMRVDNGHPNRRLRIPANRRVDRSMFWRFTGYEREIST
jgi:hypothetical protein